MNQTSIKLPLPELLGYFALSLVINALGNGITVALNLGSALWTASAVNISHLLPIDLGTVMMGLGGLTIIANALLLRKWEWRRVLGNLIFMLPFSYLVGGFSALVARLPWGSLPLWGRILFDLLGICLIAIGVSLYQRVNLMLHPSDDLMQIIRFHFFKGSAVRAQLVAFMPPLTLILICVAISHHIYAVNIGTIFSLAFSGSVVGWADTHIFPRLKHQRI
ncbi:YczE/YyaS/YitT family protein [Lacticaseibacillus mingshuiensis]|uniref:YitT family protein n=2 Tax=Lacticaseibacillus mingshuiensis TaxID=2799574 RepID=A0ABW4CJT4_9LACO|nr:hypothetical protein [Lacticaseibacillus mingshuiensis]